MKRTRAAALFAAALIPVAVSPGATAASAVPDIETFMQIGWAGSPRVSPDATRVYFTSAMSGVPQVYRLTDDGWPYQLTVFVDGVDYFEPSPDGARLIVGASRGGSEYSQLHLVDGATGAVRALTADPRVRHTGPAWSPDGRTIYYSSNQANGTDVQIYAMDLASGASRSLFARAGNYGVSDVSPAGSSLLVTRYYSNEATDLYLVDAATGEATHLTPHEGSAFLANARFSGDGRRAYLIADTSSDGIARIGTIDLGAGGPRAGATRTAAPFGAIRYLDPAGRWEAEDLAISPDGGRYLAWIENEEGYGRLHLRDLVSSTDLPVPEARGVASGVNVASDGTLVFAFDSAIETQEVRRWDFRHRESRTLTHSTYAGVDPATFREPELVRYSSFDGRQIPAFLYLPADRGSRPLPFVIHIHGGPESQFRPEFTRHFQYLLARGYGILAPNIRGSRGYGREYLTLDNYRRRDDAVKDVGAAGEWLISKGYTAREMLAIKGDSYGGYMTMAALARFPDLFAAGIEGVGISNFITMLRNTADYRRALREAEYGPLSDSTFLREISPLTHVDRIRAPLLVIAGENDPRVPVGEARQIAAALTARGQVADTLIFPDEGHGVAKRANSLTRYRRMVDFLDRYARGPLP